MISDIQAQVFFHADASCAHTNLTLTWTQSIILFTGIIIILTLKVDTICCLISGIRNGHHLLVCCWHCKVICGAPTTLAVKGLMMMMTLEDIYWHNFDIRWKLIFLLASLTREVCWHNSDIVSGHFYWPILVPHMDICWHNSNTRSGYHILA